MLEGKLKKKYDFFEFYSELKIPRENILNEKESQNLIETSNLIAEEELTQYNNNLKIEHTTFIIKAPNKLLIILSINKDLPLKVEKNKSIFAIPLTTPILQVISFMPDSKNESIIISTGDSIDNIQVLQIDIRKLMHEASYNILNFITNSLKIIPIKDSLALVLHYSTAKYGNGGLKLWKHFREEIYNFNKVYNFTYNFQNNKIVCLDNKEAPYIFSIYSFDETYFNKTKSELLQPEFFISLNEFIKNIEENEIELFLHLESFSNIICFWAKNKNILSGYLLGIFFVNFKDKKCFDYVEITFEAKNQYIFKINEISNEIYLFNLTEEMLNIYSFNKKDVLSSDDLYISKIQFNGNIKGVDFTENNGLVILTEQNNLVCYSKNENIFKNSKKEFKSNESILNDNFNNSLSEEDLLNLNNNINKLFINSDLSLNKFNNKEENLSLNKQKSEHIKKRNIGLEKIDLKIYNKKNIIIKDKKKERKEIKEAKELIERNDINIPNKNKREKKLHNNIITIKLDSYTQTPKEIGKINKIKSEKIDRFCQTDEKKREKDNEINNNFEIKENILDEDSIKNEKDENENKINITIKNLEKQYKLFNERNEIKNKFLSINNDKLFIIKLINAFKDDVNKLENDLIQNITESNLNQITDNIISINSNLEQNLNNISRNNLFSNSKNINIILIKSKYFISQTKSIILDMENIKNKIIDIIKNQNDFHQNIDNKNNCDYESIELINKVINIELINKKELKNKIEKLLFKIKNLDDIINSFSEINSNKINNENKLIYMIYNCLYEINKINEMYKYNKFKISKKQENELIYGLINPFIEFIKNIISNFESKIEILSKDINQLNKYKENLDKKINSLCLNKSEIKEKNEKEDGNIEYKLSNYLEEIYEENNFYSYKGNIVKNQYIIIEDEFKS